MVNNFVIKVILSVDSVYNGTNECVNARGATIRVGHGTIRTAIYNNNNNPNYLTTLVQKRNAYRGAHVRAFNLEF